jgi:hypothetical protein
LKTKVYVDTSVIGGCLDSEYEEWSNRLFDRFRDGRLIMVVSDLTLVELMSAPEEVREVLKSVPGASREDVALSADASALAEAYLAAKVLTRKQWIDAQHIAIATTSRVGVLVSWNFKHIVNLQRIHGYNSVNLRKGYPQLEIRTPREVISDDES